MNKWKVYLSSTYMDMKDLRATIINLFHKQLQSKFDLTTIMEWMYDDGNQTLFQEDCKKAVEECHIYILLLGNEVGSYPPNETRTYTEIELDTAKTTNKRIFVMRLKDFGVKAESQAKHNELLEKFKGRNIHAFEDETSLVKSLYDCLIPFVSQNPVDVNNPYKGLNAFEIHDGKYFWGRSHEIEESIKKLLTSSNLNTPLYVIGNSGIGKTSFVQAGIMYQLLNSPAYKKYHHYRPIVVNPGSTPYTNLKFKADIFHSEDIQAFDQTILFLNQFEEIITQCTTPESNRERVLLFSLLDKLVASTDVRCLILVTFRSDFLSQLANFDFIKNANSFALRSLNNYNNTKWEESIQEIITQPALQHGVTIEPELVKLLLEEMRGMEGALPLLEFTLEKLWMKDVVVDGMITTTEFNKITDLRGMAGVIAIHAENVIKGITQGDSVKEKIVKSILVNLVAVNNTQTDVKKTVSKATLFERLKAYPSEKVQEVYEQLIGEESRLLVESEGQDDSTYVDLVHEILIRKWDNLKKWINERREALEYKNRLSQDCQAYEKQKLNVELYGRTQIKQYKQWVKDNLDLLDTEIEVFIQKSMKSLRQKYIIAIATVAILAICIPWGTHIYNKRDFNHNILPKSPLHEQLEAVGNNLDSLHTLTIDASNYSTVEDFFSYNDIHHIDTLILDEDINDIHKLVDKNKNLGKVTSLTIRSNAYLEDLSGIENLTNLTHLTIEGNANLSTLVGIRSLIDLQTLTLINNFNLQSIEGIESLKNLKSLVIMGSDNIINIEEIDKLSELKELSIGGDDNLQSIGDFKSLNKLTTLTIGDNAVIKNLTELAPCFRNISSLTIDLSFEIKTLEGIENFKKLKKLTLSRVYYLENIQQIRSLPNLEELIIYGNANLINLNGIEDATKLSMLKISNNKGLTSLTSLNKLEHLRVLSIIENENLKNLEGVEAFSNLSTLELKDNINLESLSTIGMLQQLQNLTLEGNDLLEYNELSALLNLKSLSISLHYGIKTLEILSKLTNLTSLTLIKNIEIFKGIEKLKALTSLVIKENDLIENLDEIKNLKQITSLTLDGNLYLENIRAIKGLKQINNLVLSGNKRLESLDEQGLEKLPRLKSLTTDRAINYQSLSKNHPNIKLLFRKSI